MAYTYKKVKNHIESNGYELLSKEYVIATKKLQMRCPICVLESNSSKPEKEIQRFVKSVSNTKIINNIKGIVKNPKTKKSFELDIYLPKIKKVIEFNGVYWHSKEVVKERDKIKNQQCIDQGIELLTIKEKDYMNNKEQTLENIRSFIYGF